MRGDLHCHTRVSDGSMLPRELAAYARRIGLDCVALTDHDSMGAAGLAGPAPAGLQIIPGIEVSTFDHRNGKKAHLLCYAPKKPGPLLDLCAQTLRRRTDATLGVIEKIAKKYPIDRETVLGFAQGSAAVYKQHIALALAQMGFSVSIFGELFREFFSSKSGWARVEPEYPDTREAMELMRRTGGVCVLAHPGVYGNFDIVGELCSMGLDGIEAFHPRQSTANEQAAVEAAAQYGLLRTGGSDFHGMFSAKVNPLGSRGLEGEDLRRFLARLGAE